MTKSKSYGSILMILFDNKIIRKFENRTERCALTWYITMCLCYYSGTMRIHSDGHIHESRDGQCSKCTIHCTELFYFQVISLDKIAWRFWIWIYCMKYEDISKQLVLNIEYPMHSWLVQWSNYLDAEQNKVPVFRVNPFHYNDPTYISRWWHKRSLKLYPRLGWPG